MYFRTGDAENLPVVGKGENDFDAVVSSHLDYIVQSLQTLWTFIENPIT
jgi:phage-related protein